MRDPKNGKESTLALFWADEIKEDTMWDLPLICFSTRARYGIRVYWVARVYCQVELVER